MNYQKRFKFGNNWKKFLKNLSEEQIIFAKKELSEWLGNIKDKTFIDIGCGSGLHSLAARMLGAKVFSFDYDNESVECAKILKCKYFPNDNYWHIERGDVLDENYLKNLGTFDIVYSWGVLHHTGNMWKALENVSLVVKNEGLLFISIYNNMGATKTKFTKFIKKTYNENIFFKYFWLITYFLKTFIHFSLIDIIIFKKFPFLHSYKTYKRNRGMNIYYDIVDWLGGYPYENAKPEDIFNFYKKKNFVLLRLSTVGGGSGCNQFLFRKSKCVG